MPTREARILHASIDVPFDRAYEFTHRPENFPKWASGLSQSTLRETARGWVTSTPDGELVIRFSERNAFGVLDHWVTIAGMPENYNPMRLVANGDGSEIAFTLLRIPGMSDADYAHDAATIEKDLASLKALLEAGGR